MQTSLVIHIKKYDLCSRMKQDSDESISPNTAGVKRAFVHRYLAITFANIGMHTELLNQ